MVCGVSSPEEQVRAVAAYLGTLERGTPRDLAPVPGAHEQSRVWRAALDGGDVVVKCHHAPGVGHREAAALRRWGEAGLPVPRLLGADRRGWLLLEAIDGEAGTLVERGGGPARARMHRAAGAFRRVLDRLDTPPDALSLAHAWARRLQTSRDIVTDLLTRLDRGTARGLAARLDPKVFVGQARTWCHRDFVPRNWIWRQVSGGEGQLVVLDLGQARPDALEADLVKLSLEVWPSAPALAEEFAVGRGASFEAPGLRARLHQAQIAYALGSLARAHRRGEDIATPLRELQDLVEQV